MMTHPGVPSSSLLLSNASVISKSHLQDLALPTLPPLPPLPPPSRSLQPSKRPSTAPGLPLAKDPQHPPKLSGFAATRASVRKTPTLSNLSDIQQPKRSNQSHLNPPSSQLLSPASPAVKSTASQSSSRSDRRSSSARRPPASFSANGIETSFGPPPSLITRSSSYQTELLRAQNPATSALAAQQQKPYNSSTRQSRRSSSSQEKPRDIIADNAQQTSPPVFSPEPMASRTMGSLDAVVHQNRNWTLGPASQNSFGSGELSPRGPRQQTFRKNSDEGMESSQSSDDLFLKMGNDRSEESETAELTARLDHMHIRGKTPSERPPSSYGARSAYYTPRRNSSPPEPLFPNRNPAFGQDSTYSQRKPSGAASVVGVTRTRPNSMTTEQKLNAYRARYAGTGTASVVSRTSDATSVSQRRASATEQLVRQHRPSKLGQITPQGSDRSPKTNRRSYQNDPKTDAADSVSTAQSAVWDEMPELKSHVYRMEHGRAFHLSGGAGSNGSQERPRTATTTVTTISSSPKLPMGMKSGLISDSKLAQEAATIHPLLHQSLARCKPLINPNLYRSLERAASDALEMAVWARTSGPNGSIYSSASAINGVSGDRQLRRKADNLCRNITELCISLSEDNEQPNQRVSTSSFGHRRESRDYSSPAPTAAESIPKPYSRHMSLEPEEPRSAPSRALERVEARRVSLMSTSTPASSPRELAGPTFPSASQRGSYLELPKSSPITPSTSLLRSGTSLLRSRRAAAEDEEENRSTRPVSRAATEVGLSMRKRNDRISTGLTLGRIADQDYVPQHSLPQSNVLRRVTGGSLQTQPTTPAAGFRSTSRFLGERLAPPSDNPEDDEKKAKRRSFGLYQSSPASGSASRSLGLSRVASLNKKRASLTAGGAE